MAQLGLPICQTFSVHCSEDKLRKENESQTSALLFLASALRRLFYMVFHLGDTKSPIKYRWAHYRHPHEMETLGLMDSLCVYQQITALP